jgi:hypothetical protein
MPAEWRGPRSLSTVKNAGKEKIEYFIRIFDFSAAPTIDFA